MPRFITHDEAVSLLPLRVRKNGFLTPKTRALFFLSFADSFRGLMEKNTKSIKNILVPDFYCPETLNVYKTYGNLVFYKINKDLTVDVDAYIEAVQTHAPDIIVHYAFLGFPLRNDRIRSLLKKLPETVLIEDCAHKILSEKDIEFVHSKHIYIDSVRKQTSLLGSHLICPRENFGTASFQKINFYKLRCMFLRAMQEGANIAAALLQSKYLFEKSDARFDALDDAIGTNRKATLGGALSKFFWDHVDLEKVIAHKKVLIDAYLSGLAYLENEYFKALPVSHENIPYFPCIVSPAVQDKLIEHLEKKNIWIGSLWDFPEHPRLELNKYLLERVVVLPLTWRTSREDAVRVCEEIKIFFGKS